jgi:hypothetical protein
MVTIVAGPRHRAPALGKQVLTIRDTAGHDAGPRCGMEGQNGGTKTTGRIAAQRTLLVSSKYYVDLIIDSIRPDTARAIGGSPCLDHNDTGRLCSR